MRDEIDFNIVDLALGFAVMPGETGTAHGYGVVHDGRLVALSTMAFCETTSSKLRTTSSKILVFAQFLLLLI